MGCSSTSTYGVGTVTAAALACVFVVYARVDAQLGDDARARRKALASLIRTVAAVLWPFVLTHVLVPEADRESCLLCGPILWVTALWCIDSAMMHHSASSDNDETPVSVRLDPGSLTGLTFGLCNLAGSKPDGRHSHLFMSAVLGALLVVLQSHNLAKDCFEAQVFESVQKAALMWCIGLLFTAVVLTRSSVQDGTEYLRAQ